MQTDAVDTSKPKSTHEKLTRVAPLLYKHDNGSYWVKKKVRGTIKVHPLKTREGENISKRDLADRALNLWVEGQKNPAPKEAQMPLGGLLDMLKGQWSGKADSTVEKVDWVKDSITAHMPRLIVKPIESIKPSDLGEWFANRTLVLGACAFNEQSRILKNAFEMAVNDGLLRDNPYFKVPPKSRRKKIQRKEADVPSLDQCAAIVENVRAQKCNRWDSDESADFLELAYRAALGSAEILNLNWKDIRWSERRIRITRQKTGEFFEVPFFAGLEEFLREMHKRQDEPESGPLFTIKSVKNACYNACTRLGFSAFSPLDFRKSAITAMLEKGVLPRQVAKWQGHRDGGVLIQNTYAFTLSKADKNFEKSQLNLLK